MPQESTGTKRQTSHLVVLGHPSRSSLNAAIAERYLSTCEANHHGTILRDLYAMDFDPRLKEAERLPSDGKPVSDDVREEIELLRRCDVVTFIYPLWFGMPPAIVKGYIDRVFGAGFRSEAIERSDGGILRGKRLAVITTSASTLPWLESQGMWISLRQSFETYLKTIFGFSASDHYHADSIVDNLSAGDAERILYEVEEFTRQVCAEAAAE
jgi:NAD(P)H dehydrogenase (quinone)